VLLNNGILSAAVSSGKVRIDIFTTVTSDLLLFLANRSMGVCCSV